MTAMPKKRLCIVSPIHWSGGMGGSEYQIRCLIDKLVATARFEIFYLARRYSSEYQPQGYKIVRIAGETGIRRYGFCFDTFDLLKLLHKIRPDVIYQRVGCAYTGITAYFSRQNHCRMVWHVASDSDVLPFQDSLFSVNMTPYIEKKMLEYGVRSSHHIIVQTHQQAVYLKKHYARKPTAVIYNFHPLPRKKIRKTKKVRIVWVANFKPLKQPEYFIRLARDLRKALTETVRCIMIGSPAFFIPEWQQAVEKEMAGLENLVYLGERSQEEVNDILSGAHILVNTSRFEGFSNTFIQAWMRKVPVVSLNVNPDHVFDQYKIGFCAGSYDKMLARTVELIRNPVLREEMGERAQAYAFEKCSEKNVSELVSILKK